MVDGINELVWVDGFTYQRCWMYVAEDDTGVFCRCPVELGFKRFYDIVKDHVKYSAFVGLHVYREAKIYKCYTVICLGEGGAENVDCFKEYIGTFYTTVNDEGNRVIGFDREVCE